MLTWDKDFIPILKSQETYFKISRKIGWKTIVQKTRIFSEKAVGSLEFIFLTYAHCSPRFQSIGIYNVCNSIQSNPVCQVTAVCSNVWEIFKSFFTIVMCPVFQHFKFEFHLWRLKTCASALAEGKCLPTFTVQVIRFVCLVLTADRLGRGTGRGVGYCIK